MTSGLHWAEGEHYLILSAVPFRHYSECRVGNKRGLQSPWKPFHEPGMVF